MAQESFFELSGSFWASPLESPGAAPNLGAEFDLRLTLSQKTFTELSLDANGYTEVSLGGLSDANIVIVDCPGRRCTLRLTSSAGTEQIIPVEDFAILTASTSEPFTAIDVARATGVATKAKFFLGKKT